MQPEETLKDLLGSPGDRTSLLQVTVREKDWLGSRDGHGELKVQPGRKEPQQPCHVLLGPVPLHFGAGWYT